MHEWTCQWHSQPCTNSWTRDTSACMKPIDLSLPIAKDNNFTKSGQVHCELFAMETRYVFSSLETIIMMHPYPGYGMRVTPTTWYPSMCNALSHLFLCSDNGVAMFHRNALENHVFGCTPRFGGTRKCERGMERFVIVLNRRRADNASLCCSWNPTSSNANTSSRVRFVPTFTGHTLGRFGQSNT